MLTSVDLEGRYTAKKTKAELEWLKDFIRRQYGIDELVFAAAAWAKEWKRRQRKAKAKLGPGETLISDLVNVSGTGLIPVTLASKPTEAAQASPGATEGPGG